MSNRYQVHSRTNPLPLKTCVPNCIGWTSLEEGIIYAACKRAQRLQKEIVKMENKKEDM